MRNFPSDAPIELAPRPGDDFTAEIVRVPSVAITGWVHYSDDIRKMPKNAYTEHRLARGMKFAPLTPSRYSAFGLLFRSGNQTTPVNPNPSRFRHDSLSFVDLIESHNYRVAVAMDNIEILRDANTRLPYLLHFDFTFNVGYTPIPGRPVEEARQGEGIQYKTAFLRSGDNRVVIHSITRFRLKGLADAIATFMTGHRAPYAWVEFLYVIDEQGGRIIFTGSSIPSQSIYLDWTRSGTYDMLTATEAAIDGFITAGKTSAPPRPPVITSDKLPLLEPVSDSSPFWAAQYIRKRTMAPASGKKA